MNTEIDNNLYVGSFRDLLPCVDDACQIQCALYGTVVRELKRHGNQVTLKCADSTTLEMDVDTEVTYESWCCDRGSLLFNHPTLGVCKLCTELDVAVYHDCINVIYPKSKLP